MSAGHQSSRDGYHVEGLSESVARLRRAMRRGARVADPDNQLAVAQLELLSTLIEHPGVRPGKLAQLMNLRPNTVTTIVNALSNKDMVDRLPANGDGRAIELSATETGQQAVLRWQNVNATILDAALSTLSVAQRRTLVAAMPSLNAIAAAVDRLANDTLV